jgi:hypothetical protein
MHLLHGLKLNCLLAPIATALVGIAGVSGAWGLATNATAAANQAARTADLAGLAAIAAGDQPPALAGWLTAHPGWLGVAQVRLDGERTVILAAAGDPGVGHEVDQPLLLALQAAQARPFADAGGAAVPCYGASGPPTVLVARWQTDPAVDPGLWLGLIAAVGAVGLGLGIYLVRRVYQPVDYLIRYAEAAVNDRPEPEGRIASAEVSALASSISTLVGQHRQRRSDDAPKP